MPQHVTVSPERNSGRWSPPARAAIKLKPADVCTSSTAAGSACSLPAPSAPEAATAKAPSPHVARLSPTSAALPFLVRSAQLRHGDVPHTTRWASSAVSHEGSGQKSSQPRAQANGQATNDARLPGLSAGLPPRPASPHRPSAKRSAYFRPSPPGAVPASVPSVLRALDSLSRHPGDPLEVGTTTPTAHAHLAGRLQALVFTGRTHGMLRAGIEQAVRPELHAQLLQLHAGNPQLLRQLDAEGEARKFVYDAATYASMIAAYHRAGAPQEAWAVLGRAWRHNVELTPAAYAEAAEAFVRAGAWRCAVSCAEALRRQGGAPPASLLAALTQALARAGQYAGAEAYLHELQQQATIPSVEVLSDLVLCCCVTHDLLAATCYVLSMRGHGLHPRPDALWAWADALEIGGHARAGELCRQRLEVACGPKDAALYGVAVSVFLRAGDLDRLAACWAQISRDAVPMRPDVVEASEAAFARAGRFADAAHCRRMLSARGRGADET